MKQTLLENWPKESTADCVYLLATLGEFQRKMRLFSLFIIVYVHFHDAIIYACS